MANKKNDETISHADRLFGLLSDLADEKVLYYNHPLGPLRIKKVEFGTNKKGVKTAFIFS